MDNKDNKSNKVTTKDKALVLLILITVALASHLVTSIIIFAICDTKDSKPVEPDIQVEEVYEEDKDEVQDFILDSSILPQDYILTVTSGNDTITYNVTADKIIYKEDGSYVIETSLGNEVIFRDGMCIIHRYNDLIEIFTEYSFILKDNVYTVLGRDEVTTE